MTELQVVKKLLGRELPTGYPNNIFGSQLAGKTLFSLQLGIQYVKQHGGNILLVDVDGGADMFCQGWLPIMMKEYDWKGQVFIEDAWNTRYEAPNQQRVVFDLRTLQLFGINARAEISEGGKTEFVPRAVMKSKVHDYVTTKNVKAIIVDSFSQIFKDSVADYSPLILRNSEGELHVTSIEDFWMNLSSRIHVNERGEEVRESLGWSIYDHGGKYSAKQFSPIKWVGRHLYDGYMNRIICNSGCIEISPNHSIFKLHTPRQGGGYRLVNSDTLTTGDCIVIPEISISNTRTNPSFFFGTRKLAWTYGFFLAEGHSSFSSESYYTILSNKKKDLLYKALEGFQELFHPITFSFGIDEGNIWRLQINSKRLSVYLSKMFYTQGKKRMKKVPAFIFKAPIEFQREFFEGYYQGDGLIRKHYNQKYQEFSSNSHSLIQGILILLRSISPEQKWRLYKAISGYGSNEYSTSLDVFLTKGNAVQRVNPRTIKQIERIPYRGYIYDLETESHTFTSGIGPIKVHNSFVSMQSFGARARAEDMLYSLMKSTGVQNKDVLFFLNHHHSVSPMNKSVSMAGGAAVLMNSKVALYLEKLYGDASNYARLYVYRWPTIPEWGRTEYLQYTDNGIIDSSKGEVEALLAAAKKGKK